MDGPKRPPRRAPRCTAQWRLRELGTTVGAPLSIAKPKIGRTMRIWKLTPVDPLGPIWKKWCPEPIIVRAECEAEARRLAGFVTNKTFALLTPMLTPVNPWFGYRK